MNPPEVPPCPRGDVTVFFFSIRNVQPKAAGPGGSEELRKSQISSGIVAIRTTPVTVRATYPPQPS